MTTLVEKKKAQLVVIANDVDPIEVSSMFSFHSNDALEPFHLNIRMKILTTLT